MPTVGEVAAFLEVFAPPALAEEWDNVGLLLGDRAASARRIMTCLTITPESAAEAVDEHVDADRRRTIRCRSELRNALRPTRTKGNCCGS